MKTRSKSTPTPAHQIGALKYQLAALKVEYTKLEKRLAALQNDNGWMVQELRQLSQILKMPADYTMKDLVAWARQVMADRKK